MPSDQNQNKKQAIKATKKQGSGQLLSYQRVLEDYIQYFETLSARSIPLIEKVAEPSLQFDDPFHSLKGLDEVEAMFEAMFEVFERPKFKIKDYAWGQHGDTVYMRWVFSCLYKGQRHEIDGMSEISFSHNGLVTSHRDYWDSGSQVLAKVPVIGWLFRKFQKKISSRFVR